MVFDSKPNLAIFDQSKDIPNLSGKVFLVTGGNAGLGEATLQVIAKNGGKVYMASRSEEKAKEAIERLKTKTPGAEVEFIELDLADLHSVQTCAETFLRTEPTGKLNVLVNNAGIMAVPTEWTTKDGFEAQLGTNYIGHYYLTELLLPALEKAAKTDGESRIVNLSSGAAWCSWWGFSVDDNGRSGNTYSNYCQSKWACAVHARFLADRLEEKNIKTYSVHPGMIHTQLYNTMNTGGGIMGRIFNHGAKLLGTLNVEQGANTVLYAALSQSIPENNNGGFIIPGTTFGMKPRKLDDKETHKEVAGWTIKKLNEKGFAVPDWLK